MKRFSALMASVAALCGAWAVAQAQPPAAPPATTAPAHGVASSGGATASKFDTKLPIEISSDSLEVLQHENKAIFTGNVVAVQGTVRLKSDVMIVHYQQKNASQDKAAPAPAAASQAASNPMGAITLIEVQGNVFVATPEESAKGDRGDYHVDSKIIHLYGDNVILTREKNILRGTALEYNLATGRSLLTNDGGSAKGTHGGRVRGVFIPADDTPQPAAGKAAGTPASAPAKLASPPAKNP